MLRAGRGICCGADDGSLRFAIFAVEENEPCYATNLRQLFLEHVGQTSDNPMMLEVERAEGVYLYGPADGGGSI